MTLVTHDNLRLALNNKLRKEGMAETDTEELDDYLMSFFVYPEKAINNPLTS